MTTTNNQPIDTIRDGALKATIWKNPRKSDDSEPGHFYSVEISRTYKQGEVFKDSYSFSGTEPLQLARLAHKAYDLIAQLRSAEKSDPMEDTNTGAAQ
jgi:hypothetical protein